MGQGLGIIMARSVGLAAIKVPWTGTRDSVTETCGCLNLKSVNLEGVSNLHPMNAVTYAQHFPSGAGCIRASILSKPVAVITCGA